MSSLKVTRTKVFPLLFFCQRKNWLLWKCKYHQSWRCCYPVQSGGPLSQKVDGWSLDIIQRLQESKIWSFTQVYTYLLFSVCAVCFTVIFGIWPLTFPQEWRGVEVQPCSSQQGGDFSKGAGELCAVVGRGGQRFRRQGSQKDCPKRPEQMDHWSFSRTL